MRSLPVLCAASLALGCGRLGYDPLSNGQDIDASATIDAGLPADANTFMEVKFPTTAGKIQGLAVGTDGSMYIGGLFNGSIDFGGGPLTSTDRSGFLVSLTPGGEYRWSVQIDGVGNFDEVQRVTALANGDIAIAGAFSGTVDFGNENPIAAMGQSDNYAARYTKDGDLVDVIRLGDAEPSGFLKDGSTRMAQDGAGNLFHAGIFSGSVDFGSGAVSSQATTDVFVRSTTVTGQFRWVRRFAITRFNAVFDLAVGPTGNVHFTGFYEGNLDFGGGPLSYNGIQDAYVASLDNDGNHRWSIGGGGSNFDYGRAIAVDAEDNVYVAGFFADALDLGGSNLTGNGLTDGFFASFDTNGAHRWSWSFGDSDCDSGAQVTLGRDGLLYVSGAFGGTTMIGTTMLVSNGARDGFVAAVEPATGNITAIRQFGADGTDTIREIAVSADSVWIGGSEDGSAACTSNPLPTGDTLTLRRLPLGLLQE